MRTAQDDGREMAQVSLFNLTHTRGRSNKYIPDATIEVDNAIYEIELKTSEVDRKSVSTSRSVTLSKLDEYRKVSWIFSQYKKTEQGFEFTGEHYFLYGDDLDPWFEKQRARILNGTKSYAGLSDWNTCKSILKALNEAQATLNEMRISDETLGRLDHSFNMQGCAINDPRISWKDIVSYGVKLDMNRPHEHVKELLKRNK